MTFTLKIKYLNEVRRVTIRTNDASTFTYSNLLETVHNLFPSLREEAKINVFWIDSENDKVIFSSDAEIIDALHTMIGNSNNNNSTQPICTFLMQREVVSDKKKAPAVHEFVTCDGCGMSPLVGVRYKCTGRDNFDLCEACEAANEQPFPMIKIYAPNSNNTINSPPPFHPFFHRGGHHHQRFSRGPFPFPGGGCRFKQQQQQQQQQQSPCNEGNANTTGGGACNREGKPSGGCKGSGDWRSRRGGCQSQQQQQQQHPLEELFGCLRQSAQDSGLPDELKAAAEALFDNFAPSPKETAAPTTTASDNDAIDEALLKEALRQSLHETSSENNNKSTDGKSVDSSMSLPDVNQVPPMLAAAASLAQSFLGDNNNNDSGFHDGNSFFSNYSRYNDKSFNSNSNGSPKPQARFVKDVSLADGSTVFPGSTVTKTWRIRNDGAAAWPAGVTLQFSSGDLLAGSPEQLTVAVAALQPNEEVDVSVVLRVPEVTGRHVSYFRLRTKENNIFGQRLWADLRVVEPPEQDWVGVNASVSSSHSNSPVVVAPVDIVVPAPVAVVAATATTAEPSALEQTVNAITTDANTSNNSNAPVSPITVWSRVWARELQLLADMGFTDAEQLIPLLQQHAGVPVSLRPELNNVPPAEGLQKVLTALLSTSGHFSNA